MNLILIDNIIESEWFGRFLIGCMIGVLILGLDVAYLNIRNLAHGWNIEHCDFIGNRENWRPYVDHVEVFQCHPGFEIEMYNERKHQRWGV